MLCLSRDRLGRSASPPSLSPRPAPGHPSRLSAAKTQPIRTKHRYESANNRLYGHASVGSGDSRSAEPGGGATGPGGSRSSRLLSWKLAAPTKNSKPSRNRELTHSSQLRAPRMAQSCAHLSMFVGLLPCSPAMITRYPPGESREGLRRQR